MYRDGNKTLHWRQMGRGCFLLIAWFLSRFYERPIYTVFQYLLLAVEHNDSGYLMAASAILVLVNTIKALLLYEGWLFFADGLANYLNKPLIKRLLPLFAIPACYQMVAIFDFPGIPHFGMPAVLSIASVMLIQYFTRDVSRWSNKAMALGLMLFSFQWLDVVPALTSYGFGWGELSAVLKNIAVISGKARVLNVMAMVSFGGVFAGALVTIELFVNYEKRLAQLQRLRRQERELSALREEQLRNRSVVEIQQLVHDLKRPLTVIIGLTDVLSHSLGNPAEKAHLKEIQDASVNMNKMVSEILNPHVHRCISVEQAMNYTLSQIRPFPWSSSIQVSLHDASSTSFIEANLILLSRAIVNILDNAHRATVGNSSPIIRFQTKIENDHVLIKVEDNGYGFEKEPLPHRSAWGSTGLGLPFVRSVAKEHNGKLYLGTSDELGGAYIALLLPLCNTEEVGGEDNTVPRIN